MTVDPNAATQGFPSPEPVRPRAGAARYLVPALVAAAVAVALGVYGRVHDPAGTAFNIAGFSSTSAVKSWLATTAFFFALVQLVSALMVYGKLPGPRWASKLHRWSGRIAFLVAVPVAVHCLYALGYQTYETRVLWHSILGCFFFGVFSAKMLLLRSERLPGWLLPLVGGLVFTALTLIWLTSALWFFRTFGVTT
ncbi:MULTISPECIES: DUF6529 family protein [Streptomyces]|jgi:hypothetical protein|uniref:DUF6529 family protein n=1 Tax=Streptomyces spinosisporus TaxID=2927582 RepID=A0ABS9XND2_9ACTN|nr:MULTISPECIES: DUF6529 family protein [Streptomyces]MCI3243579.1 DUF6529 family protein [Streptomyces spinosisporus]WUB39374.1 DUF6529 family protein [Streptomyces sp. NBC_00588]